MIVTAYGAWSSPINSGVVAGDTIGLREIRLDGRDVYWLERRPAEARELLVRARPSGELDDTLLPEDFNVRSTVHSYGGGAATVAGGVVYASSFLDQRLYRCDPGQPPRALTPAPAVASPFGRNLRYADGVAHTSRKLWIGVREDHTAEAGSPVNTIVGVDVEHGGAGTVLVAGADFYSSPRVSPDGAKLAWLCWNHPNMPWSASELWIGDIAGDGIRNPTRIAGGESESIFQPEWSPSGALYFVSDRTNWWNLYCWQAGAVRALCEMPAEFGQAQWVFGLSTYAPVDETRIACSYSSRGLSHLALLDVTTRKLIGIDVPETELGSVRANREHICYVGGSATAPPAVVRIALKDVSRKVLRAAATVRTDIETFLTQPRPIEFPTSGGKTAFGLFYPPHNPLYAAPETDKPPLLVKCHGGPTAAASSTLNLGVQFWTSRGIAVLDVNYGGSTGFGREYRDRLQLNWGIVDVDDCVNGARYLADQGLIDGARTVITGGSAGGYTTLAALAFRRQFKAGASLYGVSDLAALAEDTHKFELRYMDWLVAPYPAGKEVYEARSPLYHLDQFDAPVIFFQGSEDKVVPSSQTERIVDALRAKNVPVSYFLYIGEDHGFRNVDNIKATLDAQLWFFELTVFRSGLTFGTPGGGG